MIAHSFSAVPCLLLLVMVTTWSSIAARSTTVKGYARDPHNKHGCKAMECNASLLFAHYSDIRKISLDDQEITSIVNETSGSTALDFVFKTGMIFWSDVRDHAIYKAPIDDGSKKQVVVDKDVTTVDGLAVDWLYNHIYWTNTDTDTIEVADFNGDLRQTLIQDNMDEPRAIAVYPSEGWMFWTDWGKQAKLERGGMDGSHREAIVTRDVIWPNSLTLDLVLRKVYWCDSKFHSIYSANFDGSERRAVLQSMEYLPYPFSLTIFEDVMYWTDWQKEGILQANKFTGQDVKLIAQSLPTPMTVHVYHSYRQPNGTNHCIPPNGLCTHLCLPAPQIRPSDPKITCACPDGLRLMSDGLTCETDYQEDDNKNRRGHHNGYEQDHEDEIYYYDVADARSGNLKNNRGHHNGYEQDYEDEVYYDVDLADARSVMRPVRKPGQRLRTG